MRRALETSGVDRSFKEIISSALEGEPLDVEDGERLLQAEGEELLMLVNAADEVREMLVGDVVTYVKNRNLNFTNICAGSCRFCAFRRSKEDPDGYVLSHQQIKAKVKEAVNFGATEICVQGGLHPDFGLHDYLKIIEAIRSVSSTIHIHGFSPAELDHIANQEGISIEEVIVALRNAGLNSVPGTAAEILVNRVREIICPEKISVERWCEIVKSCHRLGLPTTATMLYGTVETPKEIAEHLNILKDIQVETGGFTEFVPLAFMPYNTPLASDGRLSPPSIEESLKVHAVARLMLAGHINNIQASWVKLGPKGAQLMLTAGANDLGGTLMEENITRAAGGSFQSMTPEQLEALARELGRIPKERTTIYRPFLTFLKQTCGSIRCKVICYH
ncbi:MAG: 5-amino-6-(D-ribitylamino)uracil--L-tyrosine 4-hydroxyphenyl transferase CofH [Candidatus Hadarchaeales archaeon]